LGSKSRAVPISGANPHNGIHRADEDFAVTDLSGSSSICDGFDDIVHALVVNDNIDFGFLQELNGEF
jgi:hypothetical protein